jgi:hypothetical protein
MLTYTIEDIKRSISKKYFIRGRAYHRFRFVKQVQINKEGDRLKGLVEGSRSNVYHVHVNLTGLGTRALLGGNCTCPVGINCKHVVALLLAGLELDKIGQLKEIATSPDEEWIKDSKVADWIGKIEKLVTPTDENPHRIKKRLLYLLDYKKDDNGFRVIVKTASVSILKKGGFGKVSDYNPHNMIDYKPAKFLLEEDITILRRLLAHHNSHTFYNRYSSDISLEGKKGALLLEEMLATRRCYWQGLEKSPLALGEVRQGKIKWDMSSAAPMHI